MGHQEPRIASFALRLVGLNRGDRPHGSPLRAAGLLVVAGLIPVWVTGCTADSQPTLVASVVIVGNPTASSIASIPTPPTVAPRELCQHALSGRTLLGWGRGTVADFRTYGYGGPTAHLPLATAFPELSDDAVGAWCATKAGRQATAWWAVVAGQVPARAITVQGPGEGRRLGRVSGPPAVP